MADYTKEEIFEIITTDDPTSTENARLYCKNSQGGFTFLSDLDSLPPVRRACG